MAPSSTTYRTAHYIDAIKVQKDKAFGSPTTSHLEMATKVDIIDIRHDAVEISLKDKIVKSLNPQEGSKRLPTLLLYDERGLQLFEEVSTPEVAWTLLTEKDYIFGRILSHQRRNRRPSKLCS